MLCQQWENIIRRNLMLGDLFQTKAGEIAFCDYYAKLLIIPKRLLLV